MFAVFYSAVFRCQLRPKLCKASQAFSTTWKCEIQWSPSFNSIGGWERKTRARSRVGHTQRLSTAVEFPVSYWPTKTRNHKRTKTRIPVDCLKGVNANVQSAQEINHTRRVKGVTILIELNLRSIT